MSNNIGPTQFALVGVGQIMKFFLHIFSHDKKLNEKNCDWVIANDVSDQTIGFGSDFNKISILVLFPAMAS